MIRRLSSIVFDAFWLMAVPVIAFAHGDAEELGHHWDEAAYTGEIRFQIYLIAAIAFGIGAVSLVRRLRGIGRNRK